MKTGWNTRLLCVLCLGLPVVLPVVVAAQSETPSVLDRVQKVDDPELAELIRVAVESRQNLDQKEILEVIRKVTLSYVQIKLLDQQIAEVSRKIEAETGPAEMRHELLLAKTELESKLMNELANLREIMGIVPRHPFEEQPIGTLNTWLYLNVIGERVYVLEGQKPLFENQAQRRWKSAGLLSVRETLDYIAERLKNKKDLPIRIDICHKSATSSAAEDLRGKIISLAKETNSQMQTEVRTELSMFVGSGESTFFLRQGKITTFYPRAVQRPDGGPKPLATGLVNPNDLEQHVLWRLTTPRTVPLTFRIEYDQASALVAKLVADTAKAVAKRLGISDVVQVVEVLVEPVPETAFLGRWRGSTSADIQTIDVQPDGVCQVMKGKRTGSVPAGVSVQGTWFLATKEIFIDINDKSPHGPNWIYRGYLEEEGNLVMDKGMIYLQGSFDGAPRQMILKKAE